MRVWELMAKLATAPAGAVVMGYQGVNSCTDLIDVDDDGDAVFLVFLPCSDPEEE